jgi:hypothetical protein
MAPGGNRFYYRHVRYIQRHIRLDQSFLITFDRCTIVVWRADKKEATAMSHK